MHWKKLALLLKDGAIAVMPTDTIYGICGSALNKNVVEKIYQLRKRNLKKQLIVLIGSKDDLKLFNIKLNKVENNTLDKFWPGPITIILKYKSKKFHYLHRGNNENGFRVPKSKFLLKILQISGPLVAPSANFEGEKPATTIKEAKKYFGENVIYYDKGKMMGKPSKVISIDNGNIKILRK